eukprot:TRINITY_DN68797_c0_g1_i1.p1 TRINITY_DN68797_c0_g1~~TRINITY_DN68797_c0_g1_i1.p1  ORF type:complete len:416 (-),score=90.49 TRINITY_DN68797_c0_g1_i1:27-1274(-)
MQNLLEAAGLDETGIVECLTVFDEEHIDESALMMTSDSERFFFGLGIPKGYAVKIWNHLRKNCQPTNAHTTSGDINLNGQEEEDNTIPLLMCPSHGQELFSLCLESRNLQCRCCLLDAHTSHCLGTTDAIERMKTDLERVTITDRRCQLLSEKIASQQLLVDETQQKLSECTQVLQQLKEELVEEQSLQEELKVFLQHMSDSDTNYKNLLQQQHDLVKLHKFWTFALKKPLSESHMTFTPEQLQWLNEKVFNNRMADAKLLFSFVNNDKLTTFPAKEFHQRCDNKGPTVVLISEHPVDDNKNPKNIFGGFASQSWDSTTHGYKAAPGSFLFSVTSPFNNNPQLFPLKDQATTTALWYSTNNGPTFGGGHDLSCGQGPYSNLGFTYTRTTCRTLFWRTGGHQTKHLSVVEVFAVPA